MEWIESKQGPHWLANATGGWQYEIREGYQHHEDGPVYAMTSRPDPDNPWQLECLRDTRDDAEDAAEQMHDLRMGTTVNADRDWRLRHDAEFKAYEAHVHEALVPKLERSAISLSVVPHKTDVKYAIELGLSIMLDKPIIAIVRPDIDMPEKLRKVADRIVEGDINTPEGKRELAEAMDELFEEEASGE